MYLELYGEDIRIHYDISGYNFCPAIYQLHGGSCVFETYRKCIKEPSDSNVKKCPKQRVKAGKSKNYEKALSNEKVYPLLISFYKV